MSEPTTASELWPLIQALPRAERLRLVRRVLLAAASPEGDRAAYVASPPRDDEFSADDDGLTWEAEGWEEFREAR